MKLKTLKYAVHTQTCTHTYTHTHTHTRTHALVETFKQFTHFRTTYLLHHWDEDDISGAKLYYQTTQCVHGCLSQLNTRVQHSHNSMNDL